MARSNVNTSFAKCFISFMAIVILLEGCVYLGLAIWGLTQDSCSNATTNIAANPFNFIMRFIYFLKEECGPVQVTVTELTDPITIDVDWTKSSLITNRMYIFMITYTVVSAVWIVTSILVLASICGPVTKTVAAITFWPWFLIVLAGSALDAVVAGFSIYDITHTTNAPDTFEYVGADQQNTGLMNVLQNFDAYFVTPAVVMTLISSRVVLIWLLNLFGTGFCLSLSRVLAKNNEAARAQPSIGERTVLNTALSNQNTVTAASVQQAEAQRRAQQAQREVPAQSAEQHTAQITPRPLGTPQPLEVVSYSIQQPIQSPKMQPLPTAPTPTESVQYSRPILLASTQPRTPADDTTYRNTETHPDRLNYPSTQPATLPASNLAQEAVAEFSKETPLNNRYTGNDGLVHPSSQPRVSAELRSQLPWSYTSLLGGKPQPPRKPQSLMKVYPEIPEPDYTLTSNKTETMLNNAESSGAPGQRESQQNYSRW